MITTTRIALALCTLGLLVAPLGAPVRAGDDCDEDDGKNEVSQFLHSTGVDPDGTCLVRLKKHDDKTELEVKLEHMDAGDYELWVDGKKIDGGTIDVNPSGKGKVKFKSDEGDGDQGEDGEEDGGGKGGGGKGTLDFAVVGKLFEIKQCDTVFFSDVFLSGSPAPAKLRFQVFMVAVGPDLDAKGSLFFVSKPDKTEFDVTVTRLDAGTYDLLVAGSVVAQLAVTAPDQTFEFAPSPAVGQQLLDFDPLGQQIDIASGGTVYLTAMMPGAGSDHRFAHARQCASDLGHGHGDRLRVLLAGTGAIPKARGKATLQLSDGAQFQVDIQHVPDGSYELRVDGEHVGSTLAQGGKGEFAFAASPGPGEGPLNFVVQGRLLEVKHGADTVLSVVFPISVQAARGTWKNEHHEGDHVRINLASPGKDLDACGVLDWKDHVSHDTLAISVCDLPAGSYDLRVGGAPLPGVLLVVKEDGKAKVLCDSQAQGKEQPLTFPVVGTTVKVTPAGQPGTVLLTGVVK